MYVNKHLHLIDRKVIITLPNIWERCPRDNYQYPDFFQSKNITFSEQCNHHRFPFLCIQLVYLCPPYVSKIILSDF